MLKNNAIKRITIASLALIILLIVYLFPTINNKEETTSYINSIKIPIYLIDNNDYVARVNILKNGKNINEDIKNIISSLTINDSNSIYLPNGFNAIIPKNTKLNNFTLDNGLLKLDFSKELLNIDENNEEKMIEAIIYSLTEIEVIKKIMIFIEGEKLIKLPHSNTYLPNELDRSFGINKYYDINSIKEIHKTTTYYIAKYNDYSYYIPVTSVNNTATEKIQVIIKNLKTSPINQTNLISYLASSATLEDYEILEDTINLSFNNNLITNMNDSKILEEVKYSIYLSLKDNYDIKSVIFELPNQAISVTN